MHIGARAARDQVAQERAIAALAVLAERHGIDAPDLTVQARDPLVRAMMQRERIADALEALVAATEPKPAPRRRKSESNDKE